jgi:hypothetical protein
VTCLVNRNSQKCCIGEQKAGVRPNGKRDGGFPHSPRLIPGEIGLTSPIEIEVVNPMHDDVGSSRVRNHDEVDSHARALPQAESLTHEAQHSWLVASRFFRDGGHPQGHPLTIGPPAHYGIRADDE